MRTFTQTEMHTIALRVNAGDAMSTIAEEMSTNHNFIRATYLAWEREQRRAERAESAELSPEHRDEAIRLIRSGWSAGEVGRYLNVGEQLVLSAWEAWKTEGLRRAHAYRTARRKARR